MVNNISLTIDSATAKLTRFFSLNERSDTPQIYVGPGQPFQGGHPGRESFGLWLWKKFIMKGSLLYTFYFVCGIFPPRRVVIAFGCGNVTNGGCLWCLRACLFSGGRFWGFVKSCLFVVAHEYSAGGKPVGC